MSRPTVGAKAPRIGTASPAGVQMTAAWGLLKANRLRDAMEAVRHLLEYLLNNPHDAPPMLEQSLQAFFQRVHEQFRVCELAYETVRARRDDLDAKVRAFDRAMPARAALAELKIQVLASSE